LFWTNKLHNWVALAVIPRKDRRKKDSRKERENGIRGGAPVIQRKRSDGKKTSKSSAFRIGKRNVSAVRIGSVREIVRVPEITRGAQRSGNYRKA